MRKRCERWLLAVIVLVAAISDARQAPAQTVSEFPLPAAGSLPSGITVGPDGNLWFTESGGGKIGRITTAGVITEFSLPNPTSQPNGITTGPDGALWFAESLGGVGRITTAGAATEFSVFDHPYGITTGPGGELWFTATGINENAIGRIAVTPNRSSRPIRRIVVMAALLAIAAGGGLNWLRHNANAARASAPMPPSIPVSVATASRRDSAPSRRSIRCRSIPRSTASSSKSS